MQRAACLAAAPELALARRGNREAGTRARALGPGRERHGDGPLARRAHLVGRPEADVVAIGGAGAGLERARAGRGRR